VPELPDIRVYLDALAPRIQGRVLQRIRIGGPSLLRTAEPPIHESEAKKVVGLRRLGKRIVIALEGGLFLVVHLMIAGRFRWRPAGAALPRRGGLAAFDFETGTLLLTEAGTRRRASLHLVRGEDALAALDPGGLEVLDADARSFRSRLVQANHTLKRALTDPHLFSGIGNAYSDEILHRARLSPVQLTQKLTDAEIRTLHAAAREILLEWTERLRRETGDAFPETVTAFREGMAVHGRHREPCPTCGAPVQRIVYARRETNYCAPCQTGGKLLADRALSRLLKRDWPRSLEELETRRGSPR